MTSEQRQLAGHLARRAGFGATPEELDRYSEMNYEALVEELLNPGEPNSIPDDLIFRRHVDLHALQGHSPAYWAYRMVSSTCRSRRRSRCFGTACSRPARTSSTTSVCSPTRSTCSGGTEWAGSTTCLVELSKDPAMIIWLDNHTNHKDSINENYGREILELFSMGVGNYTEDDIKECSRAFTGWSVKNGEYMAMMAQKDSIWPYGRIFWHHEYRGHDHDDGSKSFLGESGPFDGDDVVEIICRQEAAARFLSRHLYNFFVADEVPVPQWNETPPRDPDAIEQLAAAYFEHDHDIRSVLRVLFNSDFFKQARFHRVKSPAEVIIGTLRRTGEYQVPEWRQQRHLHRDGRGRVHGAEAARPSVR